MAQSGTGSLPYTTTSAPRFHAVDAEGVDRMLTKHHHVLQKHLVSHAPKDERLRERHSRIGAGNYKKQRGKNELPQRKT